MNSVFRVSDPAASVGRVHRRAGRGAEQVARVIADLKPHHDRSEAVAACVRTCEANRD